ncbi:hypothetical protein UFOVP736_34 [uncultured Caudovirales phage]|uniref:Uncharacterized protein n=1 Tax=uncultured Caudovirales phage TaxID=2100421 RepID=A0A6J5NJS2_9CAUD|nr:hypothetical protein UFOVP705_47 [uncultured Caudovirales phage]CAB5224130.1 hypothetical protein UFOVP736_34 [uncultured Caudovirales phage]
MAKLTGQGTPEREGSSGTLDVGAPNQSFSFSGDTHVIYSRRVRLFSGSTSTFDLITNAFVETPPYTAAIAQRDTATAAGTITLAGNAAVTVTAAGLTGSPLAISVPVSLGDTASVWAGKVRTALAANAAIAAMFEILGSGTSIILDRIIDDAGVANDATLNIALANGTCTGITPAASSANTISGSVAVGGLADGANGVDAEGLALPPLSGIVGFFVQGIRGSLRYNDGSTQDGQVDAGGMDCKSNENTLTLDDSLILEPLVSPCEVIITVACVKGAV